MRPPIFLCVAMVTVAAVVMMTRLCKGRGREQKHQGQDDQFLHAEIVARTGSIVLLKSPQGIFAVTDFFDRLAMRVGSILPKAA